MNMQDLRVLIVEDDHNVRMSIKIMLKEMGVSNIVEAQNGLEALSYFPEEDYADIDLVICDWNMPKKTGIEFIREIQQTHPNVITLMVSARADISSVMAAKESGILAYIRKPFTFMDLQKKIETALVH